MRVHLIKRRPIEDFTEKHSLSKNAFNIWLSLIKSADWVIPGDIQATFGSADLLGNGYDRVVFNIGANKYRLICSYLFGNKQVHLFVCWIGTHAEYTELCKKGHQYTVSIS